MDTSPDLLYLAVMQEKVLAPVLLTVFQANSKFHKNLEGSGLKHAQLITMEFCTCHDSYTAVMSAKFHCYGPNVL